MPCLVVTLFTALQPPPLSIGETALCLAARDTFIPLPANPAVVQWWAKPLAPGRVAALFINGGGLGYDGVSRHAARTQPDRARE